MQLSKISRENKASISFCVISNGKRPETTQRVLNSLRRLRRPAASRVQIIMAGILGELRNATGLVFVAIPTAAREGRLGALRNAAGELATGDVIVFCDDDMLFPDTWLEQLCRYTQEQNWEVLGTRILLPDGGRYWDRALVRPHEMVDYDFPADDPRLYQTGGMFVIRRSLFARHRWDASIGAYADGRGDLNEDVEYSQRLIKHGHHLCFDPLNVVWHCDFGYRQVGKHIVREQRPNDSACPDFCDLLDACI